MDTLQKNKPRNSSSRLLDLAGGLPYGAASRLLSFLFGNRLLQRALFGQRRRQLQRMRKLIGCTGGVAHDLMLHLLGRYTMDRRTNERQAWYLAFYDVQGVGQEFPERYRRAVEAVTAADVQRVARQGLGAPTTLVLRPR